eukprot:GEMP01026001.1.p1 GENE.GEMP01026001.1~~GEMP01026001.1.p1  ORF type:complete len:620 (+),score=117.66 GEMP01026001.1:346-2205(+)
MWLPSAWILLSVYLTTDSLTFCAAQISCEENMYLVELKSSEPCLTLTDDCECIDAKEGLRREGDWESVRQQYVKRVKEAGGTWDAVKMQYDKNKFVLLKFVQFREKYDLELLGNITRDYDYKVEWPENVPGSRTPTSDFDIPIAVKSSVSSNPDLLKHLGDDVKVAKEFTNRIEKVFGAPPGIVYDTNIYVQDFSFSLLGDNSQEGENIFLLSDISNQDIAALTKILKYATLAEWTTFKDQINQHAENNRASRDEKQKQNDRFEDSLKNIDDALTNHLRYTIDLIDALSMTENFQPSATEKQIHLDRALVEDTRTKVRNGNLNEASSAQPLIDAVWEISEKLPALYLHTTYALYLARMQDARSQQIILGKYKRKPKHSTLVAQSMQMQINRLVRKAVYFAPEAYSSEGAVLHIVKYEQSKDKNAAWKVIEPHHLLCSMNEQAGDFYKETKFHLKDDETTALYQGSKYLTRFYDAIVLLKKKLTEKLLVDTWSDWPPAEEIVKAIKPLLEIRRHATMSSEEKGTAATKVAQNDNFTKLVGQGINGMVNKVQQYAAAVNANYRLRFDMRRVEGETSVRDESPAKPVPIVRHRQHVLPPDVYRKKNNNLRGYSHGAIGHAVY